MTVTRIERNFWEPSLTPGDVAHLKALGLRGAQIKGNPSRLHLKHPGEPAALCGARPGAGRPGSIRKTAWFILEAFEAPGRTTCEACLKAAERLEPAA